MPRRDSIPVERSSVSASVRARRSRLLPLDVHQLVLEQALVGDGEATGGHEAPGREGGKAELVGPALGVEAPVHDGEGALGVGALGRLGQGQVHPQPVVRGRVDEAGRHPHDALVGAHLDVGGHLDGHLAGARPGDAVDVVGPGVAGHHRGHGPHRPPFGDRHGHGVGGVDDAVAGGGRVVVGVAVVAAVDETAEPGHAVDGEGPVVAVDGHGDEPVRHDHGPLGAASSTVTGCVGAAGSSAVWPKPGTSATRTRTRRTGGWSMRMRTMASGRAPRRV